MMEERLEIEYDDWRVVFGRLSSGDMFISNLDIYVKMDAISNDYDTYNAIDIRNGRARFFEDDAKILNCWKAKLIIER